MGHLHPTLIPPVGSHFPMVPGSQAEAASESLSLGSSALASFRKESLSTPHLHCRAGMRGPVSLREPACSRASTLSAPSLPSPCVPPLGPDDLARPSPTSNCRQLSTLPAPSWHSEMPGQLIRGCVDQRVRQGLPGRTRSPAALRTVPKGQGWEAAV